VVAQIFNGEQQVVGDLMLGAGGPLIEPGIAVARIVSFARNPGGGDGGQNWESRNGWPSGAAGGRLISRF